MNSTASTTSADTESHPQIDQLQEDQSSVLSSEPEVEVEQLDPIEKAPFHAPYKGRPKGTFPVMEIFGPVIQGEGLMAGVKTHFIRFGGCDYRCKMCDSMHAVDPKAVRQHATWHTANQIIDALDELDPECSTPWITLSGGNPAMWDLTDLVAGLPENYRVAVETQGSIWRPWLAEVDMLTISPKAPGMGERFDRDQFARFLQYVEDSYQRMMGALSCCIKVPVFNQLDLEFVAALSDILDHRRQGRDGYPEGKRLWPDRYLSLGNHHPPTLDPETLTQDLGHDPIRELDELRSSLLGRWKILLEDYLADPRLKDWVFLPQLHVLLYGNRAGV